MFFLAKIRANINKWAIFGLFFVLIILIGTEVKAELYPPTAEPPGDNTAGFIDISVVNQGKQGPLRLGTADVASTFNYQLEVLGDGAVTTRAEIDNDLLVAQDDTGFNQALFVDSENDRVCVGDCFNTEGSKFEISDRGVAVNYTVNIGNALAVYSDQDEAFYTQGTLGGLYVLSDGEDNYSIYSLSTSGSSLTSNNPAGTYSAIAGVSLDGIAIYGTNLNNFGLWSAYFDGRLQGNTDVSAAKLVTKNRLSTLIGLSYGQVVANYNFGNSRVLYHDGTYVWLSSGNQILKVRASDGLQVYSSTIGSGIKSMIYDDKYYWVVHDNGISKFTSVDGSVVCAVPLSNPSGLVFTGREYWAVVEGTGEIIQMNDSCGLGSAHELVDENNFTLGKLIYDGNYIWILATRDDNTNGSVITFNPSTREGIRWDGLIGQNPVDIYYDNYYFWTLNAGSDTVSQFYLQDNKVCSQKASDDSTFSCQTDTQCQNVGLGTCSFHRPQIYGGYPINYVSSHTENNPTNFVFSDEDIWINNNWKDSGGSDFSEIIKMSIYDPVQTETIAVNGNTTGIAFDQSYLWISTSDDDLYKIFSGVGYGKDNLSDTLALQSGSYTEQLGSFNISGNARIDDTLNSEGNLSADSNIWEDSESGDIIISDEWEATGDLISFNNSVLSITYTANGYLLAGDKYDGHIHWSDDNGDTWHDAGSIADYVWGITEANDGTLFAATSDATNGARVFTSTDNGQTWTDTDNIGDTFPAGSGFAYEGVNVYYNGTWYMLFGEYDSGIYRTSDDGITWDTLTPPGNANISTMVVTSNGYLYAASKWYKDFIRTDDAGDTWQVITSPPIANDAGIYSIMEGENGDIFISTGSEHGDNEGKIFKTSDGGISWENVLDLTGIGYEDIFSLINANGVYYASARDETPDPDVLHIYASYDQGDNWSEISAPAGLDEVFDMTVDDNGLVYLGGGGNYPKNVYRTGKLAAGDYHCPNGHFITNLISNDLGQVIGMECRPI